MTVKFTFDKAKLNREIEKRGDAGLEAVGQQAMKNMTEKVPSDSGELYRSGLMKSEPSKLILTWDTPYAKRMWYGENLNFKTDGTPPHSQPQAMWAQKDWDENKAQYNGIMEKMKKVRL